MFYLASKMSALRKGNSVRVEAGQNVFVREATQDYINTTFVRR